MKEFQKIDLFSLTEKYGTPLYAYDVNILKKSYSQLKTSLSDKVDIFYSLKANPNIALCSQLQKLGACAEVCSIIELETALRSGFLPKNIIFVGPAKTEHEISRCLELNIYAIICESKSEFQLISDIAKNKEIKSRVALRINPNFVSKNALLKMGGQASQFGMDEEIIFNEPNFFLSKTNIKIIGIHVYNGTRILDSNTIVENTKNIFELSTRLSHVLDINFEMIDIGGGLGVPYFPDENNFEIENLKSSIQPLINQFLQQNSETRIILESGRFLVANCGIFISKIIDIKISKGENFIITDGGTNCHMAAVGVGSFLKRNFPISLIEKNKPILEQAIEKTNKYNITGPLCTPGDVIGKNVELNEAHVGDLIIIHRSGAYGLTASPGMFLSHGFPAEVLIQDEETFLVRKRQSLEDFFSNQNELISP